MGTSYRGMPCSRRFLKLALCKGAVPLHHGQLGVYSAQGLEAFEAKEVSDDELEAEDQKAVASAIILQQREQKLPCAQGRQLGHGEGGHHCLAKAKRVNWARLQQVTGRALPGQLCVGVFRPGELEALVWLRC